MIKKILFTLILLPLSLMAYSGPFYVAASSGNDNNAGTFSSPFKTIQRAIYRMSANTASNTTMSTCYIAPGIYSEQVSINSNYRNLLAIMGQSNIQPVLVGSNFGSGGSIASRFPNIWIQNIQFRKCPVGVQSYSNNLTIYGCLFTNCTICVDRFGGSFFTINKCRLMNTSTAGYNRETGTVGSNVIISSNIFTMTNVTVGISINGSSGSSRYATIIGNTFWSAGHNIYLLNANAIRVAYNRFNIHNGGCMQFWSGDTNVIVEYNTFSNTGQGLVTSFEGGTTGTFRHNTIFSSAGSGQYPGVLFTGVSGCSFISNTMSGDWQGFDGSSCSNILVAYNVFSNINSAVVLGQNARNCTVKNNRITSPNGTALWQSFYFDQCHDDTIYSNLITHQRGIETSANNGWARMNVHDNIFSNQFFYQPGLTISDGGASTNNRFVRNTVYGGGGIATFSNAHNLAMISNLFLSSIGVDTIILRNCSGVTLRKNAIISNERHGLYINQSTNVFVYNNDIMKCAFNHVYDGTAVVAGPRNNMNIKLANNIYAFNWGNSVISSNASSTITNLNSMSVSNSTAFVALNISTNRCYASTNLLLGSYVLGQPSYLVPHTYSPVVDQGIYVGDNVFIGAYPDIGMIDANNIWAGAGTSIFYRNMVTNSIKAFKIRYTNNNNQLNKIAIYTKISRLDVRYKTNSSLSPAGWTNQFSTNSSPNQSFNSMDYVTYQPAITKVKWVRWKKERVAKNESGFLYYSTIK